MKEHFEESYVEPQVAEAAKTLEAKGYKIGTLAGQAGRPEEGKQAIVFESPRKKAGENPFDADTMQKLQEIGVRAYMGALPVDAIGLEFVTGTDDMEQMTAMWKQIAEVLPRVETSE